MEKLPPATDIVLAYILLALLLNESISLVRLLLSPPILLYEGWETFKPELSNKAEAVRSLYCAQLLDLTLPDDLQAARRVVECFY